MNDMLPIGIDIPNGHFIGGELLGPQGNSMPVARPSDGVAYADLPLADADIVDRAVSGARAAIKTARWARGAPRERARLLRRLADLIDTDAPHLAMLEAIGSTRTISEARAWDVPTAAETIRFFAEFADKIGGHVAPTPADHLGMTINEPYGVVAAIAPWNFPLVMACWKIGAALAAGNAVVLKPSEMTPFSIVRVAQLAIEAGIPAGILNIVQGTGAMAGDLLCRHPSVAKITFTGSTRTGVAIMTAAAQTGIKPVTLELGGKSPQIVFADADLERAATAIAKAITVNAGQVCVAGSRLLVHTSVRDALVESVARLMTQGRPGPTWQESSSFSPIVSEAQLARIDAIVATTRDQGASVRIGGKRHAGVQSGPFYAPTILEDVRPEMDAVRLEIFGPVLTVETFEEEEEALALADHPDYGLCAGVHTRDLGRAMRMMRGLEAGTVWINRYGRSADFILPTGGFKGSGIGKDLGREAFEGNLKVKAVLADIGF